MKLRNLMQNGRELAQKEWPGEYCLVVSRNGCKVTGAAPAFIPAVRKLQLFRTPNQSGLRAVPTALRPVFSGGCHLRTVRRQRSARQHFKAHELAASNLATRGGFLCDILLNKGTDDV